MKNKIPFLLVFMRLTCGLLIPFIAYFNGEMAIPIILVMMGLCLIFNLLDGVLARKYDTPFKSLRIKNSVVDRLFWIAVTAALCILFTPFMETKVILMGIMMVLDLLIYAFTFIRFREIPSPHNYSTKLWELLIIISFTEVLITAHSPILFDTMILLGFISRFDSLLIYIILPKWDHDIPSFYHALRIRKGKKIKRLQLLGD